MQIPTQVAQGLGAPGAEVGEILRDAWGSSYRVEDGSPGGEIGK